MVHSQKAFKVYITLTCPQAGILIETKREFNKTKCDLIMWRPSERQFKLLLFGWVNPIILTVDWVIPENIHTTPQTYFVFIEMNIQCGHIHVANICL